ncbi:uncharacterized protein BO95DRAFT_511030 [Aspergillus brunneoviolaceus CBS 621.78]|uniref:Uncharacterized protein n=1 Tax=Aspergillus brunneoviolaceus CBS 621.78 TaxID=1450534 RepID=A0ACD1GL96_9EURO|nr:hypothetical protein BO95DRAFT_511030 [Aspergillus brunneoviolaceus CBS 621.78]RAH50038.1 hypothetical protein BO95DRAFT_511030 [Aspergillus brunneoviolaceus CBS 621.78]
MTPPQSWMLPSLVPEDLTLDGPSPQTHLEIVEILDEAAAEMSQEESHRKGVKPNVLIELLCRNTASGAPAMVQMYVQIPVTGTEWQPPSKRARQAVDTTQGPGGWVPGGYVLYIALTTVREEDGGMVALSTGGIGEGAFYEMSPAARAQVRLAFKAAFTSFGRHRIVPSTMWVPSRLFWDPVTQKIFFVGDFERTEREWKWDDEEFRRWRISEEAYERAMRHRQRYTR